METIKRYYKVICRPSAQSYDTFASYFETLGQARAFAKGYSGQSAKVFGAVEMYEHHTASARGYLTKGRTMRESYTGKFGTGFIDHRPNCEGSPHRSNNYHYITYYIEK